MPAYLIARVEVTDPERYADYVKLSPGAMEKFGGRFLARGGEVVSLEGESENRRIVVVEFPSLESIQAFYDSPEYLEARRVREGAAVAQFIAVDGVP